MSLYVGNFIDDEQFSLKDLNELRGKLQEIKNTMTDGKLPDLEGHTSSGQDLVVPLLERCFKFSDLIEKKYVPSAVAGRLRLTRIERGKSTRPSKRHTIN